MGRIAAVPADDAADSRPYLLGVLEGEHQIAAYVLIEAAAAHGNHQKGVALAQPAGLEPFRKDGFPAFIVGASSEFRDNIGGGVGFHARQLAEVVDRVRGVPRSAADSQDEKPAASSLDGRQQVDNADDRISPS